MMKHSKKYLNLGSLLSFGLDNTFCAITLGEKGDSNMIVLYDFTLKGIYMTQISSKDS